MSLDELDPPRLTALYLCTLAYCLALGMLASAPPWRQIESLGRQIDREASLLAADQRASLGLPWLRERHARAAEEIAALEPTVAPKLFVATLLQQLDELAGNHGLTVRGAVPLDRGAAAPVYLLQVSLVGPYRGLLDFVEALQSAPKAIAVDGLEAGAKDGEVIYTLRLLAWPTPGIGEPEAAPAPPIGEPGLSEPDPDAPADEPGFAAPTAPEVGPPSPPDEGLPPDSEPTTPPPAAGPWAPPTGPQEATPPERNGPRSGFGPPRPHRRDRPGRLRERKGTSDPMEL